ncbi:MAG: chorismate synthase [Slackia sp.]|nr:chorismate synthase [Slackia sp.]
MASCVGEHFRVTIFGQSHSAGIGCVIEGVPAGKRIDLQELQAFLARRAPSGLSWSTSRKEADIPEILSGLVDGVACGAPFAALIRNTGARSSDYKTLRRVPRPGHADYVADVKFGGAQDVAGGGHFSGRLTAPLCIAGGIAKQLLAEEGIAVGAHVVRIAGIDDAAWPLEDLSSDDVLAPGNKAFPVVDDAAGARMRQAIEEARAWGDSVGGVVECAVTGLPVGIGAPLFDGLENAIARIIFGIPAVKGVEFGRGFAAADMRGSAHNDPYRIRDGRVAFASNNAGGILGGISTGEPVVVRAAFKPTSSIFIEQDSVDLEEMADVCLALEGRHDPCVAVRAVPAVEAACAIAVYDAMLEARMDR